MKVVENDQERKGRCVKVSSLIPNQFLSRKPSWIIFLRGFRCHGPLVQQGTWTCPLFCMIKIAAFHVERWETSGTANVVCQCSKWAGGLGVGLSCGGDRPGTPQRLGVEVAVQRVAGQDADVEDVLRRDAGHGGQPRWEVRPTALLQVSDWVGGIGYRGFLGPNQLPPWVTKLIYI